MNLQVIMDRILVKRDDPIEQSKGGIIYAQTSQTKSDTGKVLAVGKGRRQSDGTYIPMSVNVGDEIIFAKYSTEIEHDGEKYCVLTEPDVLAVKVVNNG